MGIEKRKGQKTGKSASPLESEAVRADEARLSGPALRAFFAIAEKWGLSAHEERTLLGCPPRSTFSRWKVARRGRLGPDVLDRISYMLGIYRALHEQFPDANQADGWVRRSNSFFDGNSALKRMLSGGIADLHAVRRLLESRSGGWG